MKYFRVAILACLLAITGLLFAIYQKQSAPPEEVLLTASERLPEQEEAELLAEEPSDEIKAPVPPPPTARQATFRRPAASPKPSPVPGPAPPPATEPSQETEQLESSSDRPATPILTPAPPPVQPERPVKAAAPPAPPPEPRTVTLPAGLRLFVRLDSTLSTDRNQPGDDFIAYLDRPLAQDGLVVAEKGARVDGRVVNAERAGRLGGRSSLSLELLRLHTTDGQKIAIRTASVGEEGEGSTKKDLKKVGWGAAIGAAIGAIAGGGKGAAIGAGAGAGAGAGTAAATRGEPVVLPPETVLDFTLAEPVTMTERL